MSDRILTVVALAVALVALSPASVHALYVDPGAGSLLVQIVISAMLGVSFLFHRTIASAWRAVRGALSRVRRRLGGDTKSGAAENQHSPRTDSGTPL
jgi:hypothetical protein